MVDNLGQFRHTKIDHEGTVMTSMKVARIYLSFSEGDCTKCQKSVTHMIFTDVSWYSACSHACSGRVATPCSVIGAVSIAMFTSLWCIRVFCI